MFFILFFLFREEKRRESTKVPAVNLKEVKKLIKYNQWYFYGSQKKVFLSDKKTKIQNPKRTRLGVDYTFWEILKSFKPPTKKRLSCETFSGKDGVVMWVANSKLSFS